MIGDGDPISTIIDNSAPRTSLCFFHYGLAGFGLHPETQAFFFFFTLSLLALAMAAVLVWRMSGICQQNAGPIYCIAHGLWLYRDDP